MKAKTIATGMAAALISTGVITACSSSACNDNQSSIPLAGFYSSSSGNAVAIDSISVGGVSAPLDSLILNNVSGMSQVYLPFRSTKPSTSFFIHYNQKALSDPRLNDTLVFDYTSDLYFASSECGALYRYRITGLKHTTHLIDSVVIADSMINNVDIERVRIYFRVNETEE